MRVLVVFASVDWANPEQPRCVERWICGVELCGQVSANASRAVADASDGAVGDAELCGDARGASVVLDVCVPVGSGVHLLTMRNALAAIMHNAYRSARGAGENDPPSLSRSP